MKKNKNAVITIQIGEAYTGMGDITKPRMKIYAERIGADFVVIDKVSKKQKFSNYSAYFAKLQLADYLDVYDRIIFLDLDTLVQCSCPNLFEVVPESDIGAVFETDYGHENAIKEELDDYRGRTEDIGWGGEYFNVGVMVLSKVHKQAFVADENSQPGKYFVEQTLINYNANKLGISLYHLDYKYNHMWFLGEWKNRGESYIVHYAALHPDIRTALVAIEMKRFTANKPPLNTLMSTVQLVKKVGWRKFTKALTKGFLQPTLYQDKEIGLDRVTAYCDD